MKPDRYKLRDPSHKAEFAEWVRALAASDNASIDEHLRLLQEHMLSGMKIFEVTERNPKQAWISDLTWTLMESCRHAKRTLRVSLASFK